MVFMMRKALVAFVVSFGLASATLAAEQGGVVGDAAAGKGKVAVCTACHGADGNSPAPTFPKLAGQGERYLIKQLHEINRKDNRGNVIRSVPTMVGQTEHLTDQDIADIAAFYASQTPSIGQAREALAAKGEEIYRGGISSKGVPACAACHAPDGQGNAPAGFPRLSGQHAEYVATSLRAYRAAEDGDAAGRANDGDIRTMRIIAYSLSDSEIEAVSSYISGLH
jgi:cytochrome c553